MSSKFNIRRHFAIRAAISKKADNDNFVTIDGFRIEITEDNRPGIETLRDEDAAAAYEAAAFGREHVSRIAG